jgi:hypothetical protein
MCRLRSLRWESVFARTDTGEGVPRGIPDWPFHIACCKWKRLPAVQKTYANFKTHIVLAQQYNRNEQRTSKEAGYRLAAQAKKMEMITENFANFFTNEHTSQALALAAANKEKLASDAAKKIALQNITNQYLQLAKKFDEAMAKMKAPMLTTNPQQVTTPRDRKPMAATVGPMVSMSPASIPAHPAAH